MTVVRGSAESKAKGASEGTRLASDYVEIDLKALARHAVTLDSAATRAGRLRCRVTAQQSSLLYAAEAKGAGSSLHLADLSLRATERSLRASAVRTIGLGTAYQSLEMMYPKGKVPKTVWRVLLDDRRCAGILLAHFKQAKSMWTLMYGNQPGRGVLETGGFLKNVLDIYPSAMAAVQATNMKVFADAVFSGTKKGQLARIRKAFPGISNKDARRLINAAAQGKLKTPADVAMAIKSGKMRGSIYRAVAEGSVLGRLGLAPQQLATKLGAALAARLPPGARLPVVRVSNSALLKVGGRAALQQLGRRLLVVTSLSLDINQLMDPDSSKLAKGAAVAGLVSTAGTGVVFLSAGASALGVAGAVGWVPVAGTVVAGGALVVAVGLSVADYQQQKKQQNADVKAYNAAAQKAYAKHIEALLHEKLVGSTSAEYREHLRTEFSQQVNRPREHGTYAPRVEAVRPA